MEREIYHVLGLEHSVLLRYQFFPNWSWDSMPVHSKYQHTVTEIGKHSEIYMEM